MAMPSGSGPGPIAPLQRVSVLDQQLPSGHCLLAAAGGILGGGSARLLVRRSGIESPIAGRKRSQCGFSGWSWAREIRTGPDAAGKLVVYSSSSKAESSASVDSSFAHEHEQSEGFSQEKFEAFLLKTQESICQAAAAADGSGRDFGKDRWQRGEDPSSGYGITRVLEDGDLLEKAAVNVSIVRGQLSQARAQAMSARGRDVRSGAQYFAGALSLVFHSCSPYVPTFRSDIRYFEVGGGGAWFGGGADLTPSYFFVDDASSFHAFYKAICDEFDPALYSICKDACDAYFYLPARQEHRGIGGIFFDDFDKIGENGGRSDTFRFVQMVAEGFMPSYLPIAQRRRSMPYGDRQRQWQLLRRGRYLEFNLLYDRGVKFGLDGGRIESIMVSAPPLIAWKYDYRPEENSPEEEMTKVLKKAGKWI